MPERQWCPITYNVREQIPDKQKLKDHLARLGGVEFLLIQTMWPTNLEQWQPFAKHMIWRIHKDNFTRDVLPVWKTGREFVQRQINLLVDIGINPQTSNIWLLGPNEPEYTEDFITWEYSALEYAVEKNYKMLAGSFSVGNPPGIEREGTLDKYRDNLKLICENPDNLGLALHEYFPVFWERGVNWYMGRFRWWLDYCKKNGLDYPRLFITETGEDYIDDDRKFLSGIIPNNEFPRGYKEVHPFLERTVPNYPGMGKYYARQILDAYESLYHDYAAAAVFSWGHWTGWEKMDVSGDTDFQQAIEHWWANSKDRLTKTKPDREAAVGQTVRVHARPLQESTTVAFLEAGDQVNCTGTWDGFWYIEKGGIRGYVADREAQLIIEEPTPKPEPEPEPEPEPTPEPEPPSWRTQLSVEELKMIEAARYFANDPTYPEVGAGFKKLIAKLADLLDTVA